MADEQKRIIGLTETEEIGTGDYIAMDSEGGGTKKIKASHFTGGSDNVMWGGIQGDLSDQTDLAEVLNNLVFIDENGYFYVNT